MERTAFILVFHYSYVLRIIYARARVENKIVQSTQYVLTVLYRHGESYIWCNMDANVLNDCEIFQFYISIGDIYHLKINQS